MAVFCGVLACSAGPRLADRTTAPQRPFSQVETVAKFEFPPMHISISRGGRLFLDALARDHESPVKTVEWKDGQLLPFPAPGLQAKFSTIHGLSVDAKDRLWILDYGNYGMAHRARIFAYDLVTGHEIENYTFPADVAPLGSMPNDAVVDVGREHIFISDSGSILRDSAIIVFDIKSRRSRRVLAGHPSLSPAKYDIVVEQRPFTIWGYIRPKLGIDGIALDTTSRWLYYAAFNRGELYRIPVSALAAAEADERWRASQIEKVADITMSDGMLFDQRERLYLSDVEHSAIVRLLPGGTLETVFKDAAFRWPTAYALAPDGQIYFTTNAIDQIQRKSRRQIQALGPYYLYRFRSD